jgi:hypothetical protein
MLDMFERGFEEGCEGVKLELWFAFLDWESKIYRVESMI